MQGGGKTIELIGWLEEGEENVVENQQLHMLLLPDASITFMIRLS